MNFQGKTVAIVGGGSGIGKAIARQAVLAGADVVISSRDGAKLDAAVAELGSGVAAPVDMVDAASVSAWAEAMPPIDHLVISASSAAHGAFGEIAGADLRAMFDAKFFGPYAIASAVAGKIRQGGSITFLLRRAVAAPRDELLGPWRR